MKLHYWAALSLAIFLAASPVRAQLGPKDSVTGGATDLERVKVGQLAPDFTLENVDGKTLTLSDLRGKKSAVLVFYRGYW